MKLAHIFDPLQPTKTICERKTVDRRKRICHEPVFRRFTTALDDDSVLCHECALRADVKLKVWGEWSFNRNNLRPGERPRPKPVGA